MKDARQSVIEIFGRDRVSEIETMVFADGDPARVREVRLSLGDDEGVEIIDKLYFNQDA